MPDRNLADIDDNIMEKYLEGDEISVDEIKAAIRKGTWNKSSSLY